MTAGNPKKPGMGLSGKILFGMAFGIPVGIFFGEKGAFVNFVGEAFVQLLQVSILPFVLVSLIVGLGKLTYDQTLSLAKKGGSYIAVSFVLTLWVFPSLVTSLAPLNFREDKINLVNMWIELKKKDGTIDEIFDHWILGKAAERKNPR